MVNTPLPTQYASAERSTPSEILEIAENISQIPLIKEILDQIPKVIMLLNPNRQIAFINQSGLDLLDCENDEKILGMRPGEALNCIHAKKSPSGCGTTEFCENCGAVNAILESYENKLSVKECRIQIAENGQSLDLKVHVSPFENSDNLTIFTITDISHEKRRMMLERIFFHDILNTAGSILSVTELLKIAAPDEIDIYKTVIISQSKDLIEEINAQKDLQAAEKHELKVDFTNLLSHNLLQTLSNTYSKVFIAINKRVEIDQDSENISFISDRILISRVLGNMIKNALEASGEGDLVTLSCRKVGTRVQFTVHNSQVMSRDVQLQIFQRSFSTKASNRGLGTYSIKLLGEYYLNGNVSFKSNLSDGTIFCFDLPIEG